MTAPLSRKYIFIYNANSGFVNGLLDSAHKLLSPKTYTCDLCAITFGSFGMKKEWRAFIKDNGLNIEFFHRDDIPEKFINIELPVVLNEMEEVIISADEMKTIGSLKDFTNHFKEKLS